jgi:MFS superfamily sulfate permease-like transporter
LIKELIDRIEPNEFAMLLLGVGVLIFILSNRKAIKRLPSWGIIMIVFYLQLLTWTATVLEGKAKGSSWNSILNLIEHAGFAASSVLVVIWCWKVFEARKKSG